MQLHQLRPKNKIKRHKRIGRGGKRGSYSGRGQKGQKARAGRKMKPVFRELIKKYPKLRGYKFNPSRPKPQVVNVEVLQQKFQEGDKIDPQALLQQGIIRKIKGKAPVVKVLGNGKILKKLIIENCQVSKSAREKIEKAGGQVKFKNQK